MTIFLGYYNTSEQNLEIYVLTYFVHFVQIRSDQSSRKLKLFPTATATEYSASLETAREKYPASWKITDVHIIKIGWDSRASSHICLIVYFIVWHCCLSVRMGNRTRNRFVTLDAFYKKRRWSRDSHTQMISRQFAILLLHKTRFGMKTDYSNID